MQAAQAASALIFEVLKGAAVFRIGPSSPGNPSLFVHARISSDE